MKKTALHFRLASWSVKNPYPFYGILSVGTILIFGGLLSIGFILNKDDSSSSLINSNVRVNNVGPSSKSWTILRRDMQSNGDLCVLAAHVSNGTQITQCYKNVGGQWEFDQSY